MWFLKRKLIQKKLLIVIIFIIVIIIAMLCLKIYEKKEAENNNSSLVEITQQELVKHMLANESFFLYIGRPSCYYCKEFYDTLETILINEKASIYYYNTEVSASKKQEIRNYLVSLGVSTIPSIIYIKKGIVEEVYNGQDENDIKEFTNLIKKENK